METRLTPFSGEASLTVIVKYRIFDPRPRIEGGENETGQVYYKRQADQETMSEVLYGSYIPLLLTYDCGLSID
jgi:hypothetical protein